MNTNTLGTGDEFRKSSQRQGRLIRQPRARSLTRRCAIGAVDAAFQVIDRLGDYLTSRRRFERNRRRAEYPWRTRPIGVNRRPRHIGQTARTGRNDACSQLARVRPRAQLLSPRPSVRDSQRTGAGRVTDTQQSGGAGRSCAVFRGWPRPSRTPPTSSQFMRQTRSGAMSAAERNGQLRSRRAPSGVVSGS